MKAKHAKMLLYPPRRRRNRIYPSLVAAESPALLDLLPEPQPLPADLVAATSLQLLLLPVEAMWQSVHPRPERGFLHDSWPAATPNSWFCWSRPLKDATGVQFAHFPREGVDELDRGGPD